MLKSTIARPAARIRGPRLPRVAPAPLRAIGRGLLWLNGTHVRTDLHPADFNAVRRVLET